MGNGSSSGNSVYVALDGMNLFRPGDNICGRAYLNCPSIVKAKSISLKITGREKCEWTTETQTTDNEGKTHTQVNHHRGKHCIFKTRIVLAQFDPSVGFSGQYAFPFSFGLPQVYMFSNRRNA